MVRWTRLQLARRQAPVSPPPTRPCWTTGTRVRLHRCCLLRLPCHRSPRVWRCCGLRRRNSDKSCSAVQTVLAPPSRNQQRQERQKRALAYTTHVLHVEIDVHLCGTRRRAGRQCVGLGTHTAPLLLLLFHRHRRLKAQHRFQIHLRRTRVTPPSLTRPLLIVALLRHLRHLDPSTHRAISSMKAKTTTTIPVNTATSSIVVYQALAPPASTSATAARYSYTARIRPARTHQAPSSDVCDGRRGWKKHRTSSRWRWSGRRPLRRHGERANHSCELHQRSQAASLLLRKRGWATRLLLCPSTTRVGRKGQTADVGPGMDGP